VLLDDVVQGTYVMSFLAEAALPAIVCWGGDEYVYGLRNVSIALPPARLVDFNVICLFVVVGQIQLERSSTAPTIASIETRLVVIVKQISFSLSVSNQKYGVNGLHQLLHTGSPNLQLPRLRQRCQHGQQPRSKQWKQYSNPGEGIR